MSFARAAARPLRIGFRPARGFAVLVCGTLLGTWVSGVIQYGQNGSAHLSVGDGVFTDSLLREQLAALGVDPLWYVGLRVVLEVVLMSATLVAAAFLLKVSDTSAFQPYLAVALMLVVVLPGVGGYTLTTTLTGSSDLGLAASAASVAFFLPVLFLFPTGSFVPRWGRVPAAVAVLAALACWFLPWSREPSASAGFGLVPATFIATVTDALRPAAVALRLDDVGEIVHATDHVPRGAPLSFPITSGTARFGTLTVTPRGGVPFRPRDRALLDSVARHAGRALASVRLTAELQTAQQRLINAADTERVKLHRELHDGIAPALASVYQRIDLAVTSGRGVDLSSCSSARRLISSRPSRTFGEWCCHCVPL